MSQTLLAAVPADAGSWTNGSVSDCHEGPDGKVQSDSTVSLTRAVVVECSGCGYLLLDLARAQWNVPAELAGGQWGK